MNTETTINNTVTEEELTEDIGNKMEELERLLENKAQKEAKVGGKL